MLQVLALGLAGSLLGVALARAALLAVTRYAASTSPTGEPLTYGLTWPAVGQGVLIGLLVALLFSIVPLLRVRRVRPSLLLRQEGGGGGRDYLRMGVAALVGVALVAVAAWQAGSWRVGLIVCAGFRRHRRRAVGRRLAAGQGDAAAAAGAMVCPAPRGAAPGSPRQSDAAGAAGRRARAASSSSACAPCSRTCWGSSRSTWPPTRPTCS